MPFELILILVVAGIIGNIIKAMGQKPVNPQNQTRPIDQRFDHKEILRDIMGQSNPQTNEMILTNNTDYNTRNEYKDTASSKDRMDVKKEYDLGKSKVSQPMNVVSIEDSRDGFALEFDRDNILSGIIFSEILSPPKGRR